MPALSNRCYFEFKNHCLFHRLNDMLMFENNPFQNPQSISRPESQLRTDFSFSKFLQSQINVTASPQTEQKPFFHHNK